jgi:outer membrane cobalamin receptor
MSKIITAAEMAEHYEPLIDLYGALVKIEIQAAEIEKLRRDHAAAVKEANIAKARLKGVEKQWHADRAALQEQSK